MRTSIFAVHQCQITAVLPSIRFPFSLCVPWRYAINYNEVWKKVTLMLVCIHCHLKLYARVIGVKLEELAQNVYDRHVLS